MNDFSNTIDTYINNVGFSDIVRSCILYLIKIRNRNYINRSDKNDIERFVDDKEYMRKYFDDILIFESIKIINMKRK